MPDEFRAMYLPYAEPETGRVGSWFLRIPWAHPHWDEYWITLMHLKCAKPPACGFVMYGPEYTHEWSIFAVDPKTPIDWSQPDTTAITLLTPPNFAYQFEARSNEHAQARIARVVERFAQQRITPDTDGRRAMDGLFLDGYPLVRSASDAHVAPADTTGMN